MTKRRLGDVVGIRIYRNDIVVVRRGEAREIPNRPERGQIVEFSKQSRKRLAFVCSNTPVVFRLLITLTYPRAYPCDGAEVKGNLHTFLVWLDRDYGGLSYLWFLEFQARGAPHIHILTTPPSFGMGRDALGDLRFRVSSNWYRIVDSGDYRHLQAGTRVEKLRSLEGGRHYGVKYAQKMYQKLVPQGFQNVGRFWGCSRDVVPPEPPLERCTEHELRGDLEGWQYAPSLDRPVYRVLYNAAHHLSSQSGAGFDKATE